MVQFIGPVLDRHQSLLLRDTLDESIPLDHPVRVYDFILDQHDWSEWHAMYAGWGRPPYPPQVMCKLLVYGYSVGVRSSRALEHACKNNLDFIWLMSGRTPDHDTIANFRREHHKEFKRIFRTTVSACEVAGMVSLAQMAVVDGPSLPRTPQGKFAKSAFSYDSSSDCYTCPTGHPMAACGTKKRRRDEDEDIHERQAERMRDPVRRQDYRLRKQTVEPTIGIIKDVLGVRRFLLRGLEYVRGEWSLAAAAFNLKKLASRLASGDAVAVGGGMYG